MSEPMGLVCSYLLDGTGNGKEVGWTDIESWRQSDGILWVHFDRKQSQTQGWLQSQSGIDPVLVEALLAEEPRPRTVSANDGLLVILRGVNLNPGADPEDMVSIRLWIDSFRIVSLRSRHLMAVKDLRDTFATQQGPKNSGDFLVAITDKLVERMGPILSALEDEADELEDQMVTTASRQLRVRLGVLRRQAISLRRYLAPQRDVMARLQLEQVSWLSATHKIQLREVADQIIRYVEDLDSARERIAVMQEELTGRLAEQMNKTMYALAIIAGIFLPLGLLTGLLGINVAGIPGSQYPYAFEIVCVILILLAGLQIYLFRRLKWF